MMSTTRTLRVAGPRLAGQWTSQCHGRVHVQWNLSKAIWRNGDRSVARATYCFLYLRAETISLLDFASTGYGGACQRPLRCGFRKAKSW